MLKKRLARTFGLAFMLAGGLLCGVAVSDALSRCPGIQCEDATLSVAVYAALFSLGGILFFWAKKP
ncbi:hypothetical protein SAMN05444287_2797 [Octadecabacter temperatus]|jgi:hypothetical protein|uniref:Uncharacterized protein n=1 Tax=Octadecabacter temperatus TaxID=1458307 RepID=A0A0K0Y9A9_9RHOB|nr:hypothetical protein [Octadecabacter temperatus]AKS47549.1 hypothetical protein OSB_30330 [Octadecabacter temperatus]SIO41406.1 hypothetical protein SAMN05444287_2797 [Octadecabacter temperatus]